MTAAVPTRWCPSTTTSADGSKTKGNSDSADTSAYLNKLLAGSLIDTVA